MDDCDPATWTFEFKRTIYLGLRRQQEVVGGLEQLIAQLPSALGFSEQDVVNIIAFGQAEDERLRAVLVNLGFEFRS